LSTAPEAVVEKSLTAVVGRNITLPCRTTLPIPVDWNYLPLSNENGHIICAAGNIHNGYTEHFGLDRNAPGDYGLIIINVTREDEGVYTCIEEAGLGLKHRMKLNVISQGKTVFFSSFHELI